MNEAKTEYPWALFNLEESVYGVSSEHIIAIFLLENIITMPDMPHYMRGVVNLRGKIVPIIDTRKFYGLPTVKEEIKELKKIMEVRKQDHINWLNELEESVIEDRDFKLTTDPHACAFGKWYDSFKTNDMVLNYLLKKFDTPHKQVHAVGTEVRRLMDQGKHDKAFDVINKAKQRELKKMVNLFNSFCNEYSETKRELVIVLEDPKEDREIGLTVDKVIAVEPIQADNENTLDSVTHNSHESLSLGKRSKDESPVFIVDENYFLNI
ncbi:chemotaxis protein CheW [Acetobacterium woodii]|uniref:CheW-like protein n=1 Tax=Acetobacterium woodii (strain ATCC 29683 / DSM 1030 / JCM 2381 / KCTC 1655 / WB1) TaxID=931626 RepID=H6LHP5_ACEWD|nr:chemotaxis protein CheW [Acetobacterium woodii]AFA47224.1 CheW-like protein [Acetobacterium woodii DSM 1030]